MNIKPLRGEIVVPGDKSISHRSIMFSALAEGTSEITDFLSGADCLSTIDCFRRMGIDINLEQNHVLVHGNGLDGLKAPNQILDAGNSGTTVRLLSGILAGQQFASQITGDASIQKRPMNRIIEPLSKMHAAIQSDRANGCAPLSISPSQLRGITYHSPVASAQVKSCVLLAGMYANSPTTVIEPALSRNHTELMLSGFGAEITSHNFTATINPRPKLHAMKIQVPGDISSAAYFIAAALLIPNSEVLIKNVGLNPTRDGIIKVAQSMNGDIRFQNKRIVSGEPVCDLLVKHSNLKAANIGGTDLIPTLIDEIPIIAVMACFAQGTTVIKDAQELKVKESNRIDAMCLNLNRMGAQITPTDDGMIIEGGKPLHASSLVTTHNDHRTAMAMTIAGLAIGTKNPLDNSDCVFVSYPNFFDDLHQLLQ
ncbi:3-phosphoshikimate 1-carboxyvinyltransferase [Eubacterium oxidoreducens]|uniref:3-phosphoshikimate 1-carboxyvinyltransferase n=1 Tax=Eubacterium oxidoreducens TaxID=1732 RepID=A0A1G6AKU2_EUBOX|nr:3-phosphoshikimate 1-carboxyvinyltransferase [Eubacterium oxidoreducens]SDB09006.1 3-phosphoshikimate 1-carboxyvinyltransferase [Eubacterium oxidoreducens]